MLNICLIICLVIIVCLVFVLFFIEEELFNKILLTNVITSISSLFICFLSCFKVNSSYIDIAIIYFLLSFISVCGYARYLSYANENVNKK